MGKSGNPAKQAEELKISQVGDFKHRLGGVQELPSGLVVKVKNPGGLKAFLKGGMIPNELMGTVQKALSKGKTPKASDIMKDGKIDDDTLIAMTRMMDSVAVMTIVEPQIFPTLTQADVDAWNADKSPEHPLYANEIDDIRQDDRLYADELPDDDKQFLFQWVSGGTRDLEIFRQRQQSGMESVVAVSSNAADTR